MMKLLTTLPGIKKYSGACNYLVPIKPFITIIHVHLGAIGVEYPGDPHFHVFLSETHTNIENRNEI